MNRRPPLPTLEQLLHLIDRATDRSLLGAEAELLRGALRRADAARGSAGGVRAELDRTRRDLKSAEDELQILRGAKSRARSPMDILCDHCGATPDHRCHGPYGNDLREPHYVRTRAAKETTA